jgi:hypothetical protein
MLLFEALVDDADTDERVDVDRRAACGERARVDDLVDKETWDRPSGSEESEDTLSQC